VEQIAPTAFLKAFHTQALAALLHPWEPKETAEAPSRVSGKAQG